MYNYRVMTAFCMQLVHKTPTEMLFPAEKMFLPEARFQKNSSKEFDFQQDL